MLSSDMTITEYKPIYIDNIIWINECHFECILNQKLTIHSKSHQILFLKSKRKKNNKKPNVTVIINCENIHFFKVLIMIPEKKQRDNKYRNKELYQSISNNNSLETIERFFIIIIYTKEIHQEMKLESTQPWSCTILYIHMHIYKIYLFVWVDLSFLF